METTWTTQNDAGQTVGYCVQPWTCSEAIQNVRRLAPALKSLSGFDLTQTLDAEKFLASDINLDKIVDAIGGLLLKEGDDALFKRLMVGVYREDPSRKWERVSDRFDIIYTDNLGELLVAVGHVVMRNLAGPLKRLAGPFGEGKRRAPINKAAQ